MIYVDSSVALAALRSEHRRPPPAFWDGPLVASRLTEYEVRVRILAATRGAGGAAVEGLLSRLRYAELTPGVLERLYAPFPVALRTLDAIHLATLAHLNSGPMRVSLATYDARLAAAAARMGFALVDPT